MRPSIKDADFSFADAAKRSGYGSDPRRHSLISPDPRRKKTPPWPGFPSPGSKDSEPAPPTWEATFDEKSGKVVALKQLRPLPRTEDLKFENLNRRFNVIVEGEAISIGGYHIEHGCKIECFYSIAIGIHGTRGRILEESKA